MGEASTSQIIFELPGLESEYFGDSEMESVQDATAEEPEIPSPDSVLQLDTSDNEEDDALEYLTYDAGLRRLSQHNAEIPPERFT